MHSFRSVPFLKYVTSIVTSKGENGLLGLAPNESASKTTLENGLLDFCGDSPTARASMTVFNFRNVTAATAATSSRGISTKVEKIIFDLGSPGHLHLCSISRRPPGAYGRVTARTGSHTQKTRYVTRYARNDNKNLKITIILPLTVKLSLSGAPCAFLIHHALFVAQPRPETRISPCVQALSAHHLEAHLSQRIACSIASTSACSFPTSLRPANFSSVSTGPRPPLDGEAAGRGGGEEADP